MSLHVVGIHGIGQGNTNARKLSADWAGALAKGLRLHHGPDSPVPPLSVAYYGDLFRTPSRHLGGSDEAVADPFSDEEEAFVLETLALYLPPESEPESEPDAAGAMTLGLPYVPGPVTATLVRVDRRLGQGIGRLLLACVRQVYRYLHHDLGARIRAQVLRELHRAGDRLVVAHSLGSVIAFDMLTRADVGPGPEGLTALVTCGSPLAWPTVRRSLGHSDELRLPDGVAWLNLHAAGDAVAPSGLAAVAPGVQDVPVDNGAADPHAAVRYLDKQALADLVVGAKREI